MSTSYPPHYAYPSAPPLHRALPQPPRLHWGWVLGLNFVTRGLFGSVWLVVQANWIRRMLGRSTGFWLAIANMIWLPLTFSAGICAVVLARFAHADPSGVTGPLAALIFGGLLALYVATVLVMRREMQSEVIGMTLGLAMTLLFGPIYLQYHLRGYNEPYTSGNGLGLASAMTVVEPTQPAVYPSAEAVAVHLPRAPLPGEPPTA